MRSTGPNRLFLAMSESYDYVANSRRQYSQATIPMVWPRFCYDPSHVGPVCVYTGCSAVLTSAELQRRALFRAHAGV